LPLNRKETQIVPGMAWQRIPTEAIYEAQSRKARAQIFFEKNLHLLKIIPTGFSPPAKVPHRFFSIT